MLTVHHLNQSRSKRVLWLLEELEMPYQRVDHQRDAQTRLAPASLRAIHPLSKAPMIVDGDVTLCESSTIMEYVLDQYELSSEGDKSLRPVKGTKEYYQYMEWSHFAEGSLSLPIMCNLLLGMEERKSFKPIDGYIAKEVSVDFGYIESVLAEREYFAGDEFTAADVMMTVSLEMAKGLGLLKGRKSTLEYLEKIQKRSAYQKATNLG